MEMLSVKELTISPSDGAHSSPREILGNGFSAWIRSASIEGISPLEPVWSLVPNWERRGGMKPEL
jgi:hypothetical protein